ncbi:hypothetical protein FPOA_10702 [Fusarium poae]|uniref:Uncharacterized protein n=2 Tax=Fusarium poae TaxID=36050 RepID=A0A1B8AER0_FUSPO|nr:hypothetical protein FPOA_10702 [Fusarium poae]
MSSSASSVGAMTPATTEVDQLDHWLDSLTVGTNTPTHTERTPTASESGDNTTDYTPTASGSCDNTTDYIGLTRKSDPHHDGRYIILDVSRSRALTCHDGYLRLETIDLNIPHQHVSEQAQWECKERGGFRGFKNIAARTFLGHDVWWDFYAKVYHHKGWEDFTLCRREGGLYWIQTLDWWTQRQVSAKEDGIGLFRQDDGGTLWEFVKVSN